MENDKKQAIALIGLGKMGSAIAKTLLKKNFKVTVWNRTADKSHALEREGAIVAATVKDAILDNGIILLSLSTYQVVDELLRPLEKLMENKSIINLSNGTPMQATATASLLSSAGAHYLDGGIMAIPQLIGQSSALILFSGSEDVYNHQTDLLSALGTIKFLGQEPEKAALYDLALLTAMYGMFSGYLQSIALIKSAGIKATTFTPMLLQWLQVMSQSLTKMGEDIDNQIYDHQVAANLDMQNASFENLIETYQELHIPVDLVSPLRGHMDNAVKAGYGKANFSAVFEVISGKFTG